VSRWKKKSRKISDNDRPGLLPGQISVFDILSSVQSKPKITHNPQVADSGRITSDIEKVKSNQAVCTSTNQQKEVLEKFITHKEVCRAVLTNKSVQIEVAVSGGFQTHWISADGSEECCFDRRTSVFPKDKILYYSPDYESVEFSKVQKKVLNEYIKSDRFKVKRIIHRKGDLNILIELPGKVIDILPNGWDLEFNNLDHVECSQDEILQDYSISSLCKSLNEGLCCDSGGKNIDIGQTVNMGDFVQALHGENIINGTITREYGMDNEILNIEFKGNNGPAATAIGRRHILKILETGLECK
jgi:hypothetical protein